MTWNESQTVREIAISNPATIRVFESLGIDYCCGGRRPLSDACERANVPVARVLEMFAEADQAPMASETQWNDASLSAIATHIINKSTRPRARKSCACSRYLKRWRPSTAPSIPNYYPSKNYSQP